MTGRPAKLRWSRSSDVDDGYAAVRAKLRAATLAVQGDVRGMKMHSRRPVECQRGVRRVARHVIHGRWDGESRGRLFVLRVGITQERAARGTRRHGQEVHRPERQELVGRLGPQVDELHGRRRGGSSPALPNEPPRRHGRRSCGGLSSPPPGAVMVMSSHSAVASPSRVDVPGASSGPASPPASIRLETPMKAAGPTWDRPDSGRRQ